MVTFTGTPLATRTEKLRWRPDTDGEKQLKGMTPKAGQGEGGGGANGTNPRDPKIVAQEIRPNIAQGRNVTGACSNGSY